MNIQRFRRTSVNSWFWEFSLNVFLPLHEQMTQRSLKTKQKKFSKTQIYENIYLDLYLSFEQIPKKRPIDVPIWPFMQRQGASPTDVLRTSSIDVLRTLKYDILGSSQCNVLEKSPYRHTCNAMGRPLPTSWGRPIDVIRTSPYGLIFNSKGRVLPTIWGRPLVTSWGRPKDVLIWYYK